MCTNGSLGCLAYSGGPLVHCDCCCTSDDNETIMLPYVGYTPSADDTGSPDTPMCTCRCNHREFNVAEALKHQVNERIRHNYIKVWMGYMIIIVVNL